VEPSSSGPRTLSGAPAQPAAGEGWPSSSGKSTAAKSNAATTSRFASLSDFRSNETPGSAGDNDRNDDDDDDPVNFFTGGERSGLSVQNPEHFRRRAENAPNVVQDILKRAREASQRRAEGHRDEDDEDWDDTVQPSVGQGESKKPKSFAGQGRSLADATSSSTSSQGDETGALRPSDASSQLASADEIANRRIIFWQDGFSLEDGPLCRYDDPQHAQTLALINQGAAPLSFLNVRYGQRVNLNVEQRRENYKPPPPAPMKPFAGSGNRLGSPAPGIIASAPKVGKPVASASSAETTTQAIQVDETQPTTQIQIRLADGQRSVGRFNQTHTVADVRRFIDAGHADPANRSYVLQMSFPPKPITDESQTLKDAGLVNAVVIQKWS
jgi:UBX domain-containing protein 1